MLRWVVVSLLFLLCESSDVAPMLEAEGPCPVDPNLVLSVVERDVLAPASALYGVHCFLFCRLPHLFS